MKVFVAGGSGAIGRRLVPLLDEAGHQVLATTRTPGKVDEVRALGAEPVVMDALDPSAVTDAVGATRPEVIVHQATALTGVGRNMRRIDREFALTNRLRSEGTDNLLAAAATAGVRRFVAQSFAGWPYAREGDPVKSEDDPLDPEPPPRMRSTLEGIRHLESAVLGATGLEGLVLRYGALYGPGTTLAPGGANFEQVRRRRFPVVGSGGGVWSFIHIDDAAAATAAAVERGDPGVYNVVDDEPAPVSEWLPELAFAIGAKPPRRLPAAVARLVGGEHVVAMMTSVRGASNAKAKRELGWQPAWSSWRQGFRRGLSR